MLSYWERNHFSNFDTVIVGAGFSGLFTALFLKRKFPDEKILILEKELFPAASTKNAGFACMGSLTELEDDLQTKALEEVVSLFKKRYEGLQIMRETLDDETIGYQENGSYELLNSENEKVLEQLAAWNERLFSVAGRNAFSLGDISSKNFRGFSSLVKNELEGEIDTGKMWHSLKSAVQKLGVEVLLNTAVSSFEKTKKGYQVEIENAYQTRAKRFVLCTNAFVNKLLPEIEVVPARAQVLITKPIKDLSFKGIYHFDRGYYYFREIDGRVLFGGGRQLDKKGETTSTLGTNEQIVADLKSKLHENILPNTNYEIDYNWSGIMGLLNDKNPICKQVNDNLFLLAGFGGMGVALAPYMAKEICSIVD